MLIVKDNLHCRIDISRPGRAGSAAGAGHPPAVFRAEPDSRRQLPVPLVGDFDTGASADLGAGLRAGHYGVTERAVLRHHHNPGADPTHVMDHCRAGAAVPLDEGTQLTDLGGLGSGQRIGTGRSSVIDGARSPAHPGHPRAGSPTTESIAQATETAVRYRFEKWNSVIGFAVDPRSTRWCSRCAIARNHRPTGAATAA